MAREQDGDQVMGEVSPGEPEAGRRPTGVSPGEVVVGGLGPGQRWIAARKREVVLRIFRGELLELLSRELGVVYRRPLVCRGSSRLALGNLTPTLPESGQISLTTDL